ncbi:TolC family protein [Costertonia aggregata]|uniref:TolC family protein n=1 Tax=Costertonia aggregata TaxID=343403 RepID=A0A7H9AQJ5_9FLAO|nr:TolC family protein [Costertonia aggregata]QLG45704.1 TolC family protein [Costertonia aggregata]
MSLKFKITTLLFFVMVMNLMAQQKWTLDECITYAIDHNLTLKDFELTEKSGAETYRQSIRNLLPGINASSDYTLRFGRQEDPNTGVFVNTDFFENNYGLFASFDIFQGFQKLNTIKASKFLRQAAKEDVEQQKFLLAFRVMTAFYNIKFFEGLVANAKEQLKISQTNYELVQRQIELGLMAGADLYEAESQLFADKLVVVQSENSLQAAHLVLIQEMNLKGATTINVQDTLGVSVFDTVAVDSLAEDNIYAKAKGFIPVIKAQELRTKAAKKNMAIAKGNLAPTLTLDAGFVTRYAETFQDDNGQVISFDRQIEDNAAKFIGVSINIPISQGWSRHSAVKQQKIAFERAKNDLEVQEQVLYQTIQQLVQEHNALVAEYEQGKKRTESQNLAFEIAQKRYEKGLINALELFTAKNLFATAQNDTLQARLRLEVNKSTLDFYRGLPVFAIN